MTDRGHVALASDSIHRRRIVTAGKVGFVLVSISLGIGIAGYMFLEHLPLVDAFLNAAMILSGMGPLHNPTTTSGKLFAGFYALFSGFAVLGIAAVVFAPFVHRIFHRMHIADTKQEGEREPRRDAQERRQHRRRKGD